MPATPHIGRATKDDDQATIIFKKMAVWNGACGAIALVLFITEKLAS